MNGITKSNELTYNDVTGVSCRFKSPGIPIVWSTALVKLIKQKHRNSALHEASIYPEDTWRNNNVIITSKHVVTSFW